jgi:spore maturation protein CgeB
MKDTLATLRGKAFVRRAQNFDPHIILVIKGYDLDRSVLERAKQVSGAIAVNWNPDNPFQVRAQRTRANTYLDSLPAYNLSCIWDDFLVDDLRDEGANRVTVLPFARDPSLHYPMTPAPKYECEVSFVGHWSKKRERIIASIASFDLGVWGPGWVDNCETASLQSAIRGGSLDGTEYIRAMSSADIVVNVIGEHNRPSHNMRTFEAPSSGSLVVTERTRGQAEFFREDEDVAMYSDPAELKQTVSTYLTDRTELKRVANNGLAAARPHTYKMRMETLLNQCNL